MKYVLVDTEDNIIDRVDLGSDVGVSGAKTYFIRRKQIEEKEFDKLWKVMSEKVYDQTLRNSIRLNGSYHQHEWWKDDGYLDIDKE
jgi:hypothetical protein